MTQAWLWFLFVAVTVGALAVDLFFLGRRVHQPTIVEAAAWSGVWVGLALAFGGFIWALQGPERAMLYLTGYVLEKSLSVDNLFVFLVVFRFFGVDGAHQARVLHWGIIGAVILRFVCIAAGVQAIARWHWVLAVFGAILLWTGAKMLFGREQEARPQDHPALRFLHKFLPVTTAPHGGRFFTRLNGVLHATPLFAALIVVEASDLVFAADSIPAALAVTPDLFLVYTSNVFAVLGLRALYFLLESSMTRFRHLKTGISLALLYVSAKLLIHPWFEIPTVWTLVVVMGTITCSIAASVAAERRAT